MDLVIGLIGAKKAGKTTAFTTIQSYLGENITEITLAGKLKDTCASVFEIPRSWFDDQNFKERELDTPIFLTANKIKDLFKAYQLTPDYDQFIRPHVGTLINTPRFLAQYVGTEVLRNYQSDIHCQWALKDKDPKIKIGVVTDIRFPNEYEYFSKQGIPFHLLYIQNSAAEIAASADTHVSEKHLKDLALLANKTLHNNDTLRTFETLCRTHLSEILQTLGLKGVMYA
jgi:GTPase SAR1 family protein